MKYQKGQSGNPNGRPKGSKNNNELRQRVTEILNNNFTLDQIEKDLQQLEPKERIMALFKLLEFGLPKLRSTELKTDFEMLSDEQLDMIINELKSISYEEIR